MRVILALRIFKKEHAAFGIESKSGSGKVKGKLVDINIDRFYSILKNIIDYHMWQGTLPPTRKGDVLSYRSDGSTLVERSVDCRLYWCIVETDLPLAYWASRYEVEAVLSQESLDNFASSIRHKSGASYIDACEQFAREMKLPPAGPIRYIPPDTRSTQAA